MTRRGLIAAALFGKHRGMVRIPGGTFRMGSSVEDLAKQFPNAGPGLRSMLMAETPAREVTVQPFWMDRQEVTNAQFQKFVRANAKWRKGEVAGDYLRHWVGDAYPAVEGAYPVVFVTWGAASAYAQWAGKRLPAEAEWEFAARGGRTDAIYPWGTAAPSPQLANYGESGHKAPVRVGSYAANPYGLVDLAGNVWEWCADAWSGSEDRRVIRGGSFAGSPVNMRVTARDSHRVDHAVGFVGFRCVVA